MLKYITHSGTLSSMQRVIWFMFRALVEQAQLLVVTWKSRG